MYSAKRTPTQTFDGGRGRSPGRPPAPAGRSAPPSRSRGRSMSAPTRKGMIEAMKSIDIARLTSPSTGSKTSRGHAMKSMHARSGPTRKSRRRLSRSRRMILRYRAERIAELAEHRRPRRTVRVRRPLAGRSGHLDELAVPLLEALHDELPVLRGAPVAGAPLGRGELALDLLVDPVEVVHPEVASASSGGPKYATYPPFARKATRSQSMTFFVACVTRMTVWPRSASVRRRRMSWLSVPGSRPEVASSRKKRPGSVSSSTPMETRLRWPPLSRWMARSARSARPSVSSTSSTRCRRSSRGRCPTAAAGGRRSRAPAAPSARGG